jgi:Nitrile hydratase beta subunit, N-terminal
MGGMDGFGKIEVEENEPVFHAAWEGHVLATQLAMIYAGAWRIDQARFAQEQLPPVTYLSASYYQRWLLGIEKSIIERGFATADVLEIDVDAFRAGCRKAAAQIRCPMVDASIEAEFVGHMTAFL